MNYRWKAGERMKRSSSVSGLILTALALVGYLLLIGLVLGFYRGWQIILGF